MDKKVTNAGSLRVGNYVIFDNVPCVVKNIDLSKTGKHGSMKCRIEAIGLIDNQKRIKIHPSSDKVDIPIVDKKDAQVLSVHEDKANVMDLESFETFDISIPEELKDKVKEGVQVTYWIIMDQKMIKQVK
ncbi:MAG: translation initiation factor IF-5A [Nanoarchaeota archaeon]